MPENTPYVIRGDDGVEYGPVDLAELRDWVKENRVGLGTSVRPEPDENGWNAWQHYPELVALLAEVRATGGPALVPVLAPVGRRMLAGAGDFLATLALLFPVVLLVFCTLPQPIFDQILANATQHYSWTGPQPDFPIWWTLLYNFVWLAVPVAYYGGFHAASGRTPAKALLQLQVVDAQGNKPRLDRALLRAFVFAVCVFYLLGIPLLYALLNPERRALHDIAAGTYVVES